MNLSDTQKSFVESLNMSVQPGACCAWVVPEGGLDGWAVNPASGFASRLGRMLALTGIKVFCENNEWFVLTAFTVSGRPRQTVRQYGSAREAFSVARDWIRKAERNGQRFVR